MKRFFLLAFFLLSPFSFLPASVARAQNIPTSVSNLTLTVSTNNPAPGEQVTVTASDYNIDLNAANMTWTVGGKRVQQGVGLTTLTLPAPTSGKTTTVSVSASSQSGENFTNSVVIGSGSVDMILESDGYTPPLFLGKVPLAYQNTVTVTALPHLANSAGKEYDPKTLVYEWKNDSGTVFQDQSGYGKQSIQLVGSMIPRAYYLIVDVSTRDASAKAEGIVEVAPQSPTLNFYVNDPLYGPLFNKALGSALQIGSQKENGVVAVPYGFNETSAGSLDLSFSWLVNGVEHPELSSGNSIVLRAPNNQSGSSNIELDLTNTADILQGADAAFTAIFSATASSSSSVTL